MMLRWLFAASCLLLMLFTGLVAWIHSASYDAAYFVTVRETFTQNADCADTMPCFMGIKPGLTTAEQALETLEGHEWVFEIIDTQGIGGRGATGGQFDLQFVSWVWNNERPRFLLSPASIAGSRPLRAIEAVQLQTGLTFAEAWLAFGQPPLASVNAAHQHAYYDGFSVRAPTHCGTFWESPVEILVTRWSAEGSEMNAVEMRHRACLLAREQ